MEFKPSRKPTVLRADHGRGGYDRRNTANAPRYSARPTARNDRARVMNRPAPRRRKIEPATFVIFILVALALLAGIVYIGSNWFLCAINSSTYLNNVFVDGIPLSSFKRAEGLEYMRERVQQQLSANYTLSWEGSSWSFTGADFDAQIEVDAVMERAWNFGHVGSIFDRSAAVRALNREPYYLETQFTYNAEKLDAFIASIAATLYIAPKDAEVAADLNNPVLVASSVPGRELDQETARAQILSLIQTGEGSNVLPVQSVEPALSTEAAMGTLNLIVEYKTDTSARGYNGRFNVRKGLSYFHGMVVQPGEEISFNEVVGPRTKERGWQPGTEYIGGGRTQEGYGGGICQASTTLYGAVVKAGMTILERSNHSMTVSYVEPSLDAAVVDNGSKDLRFRNDTASPITIYTEVTKEYAAVRIYGQRPLYRYELESVIVHEDQGAARMGYIDDTEGKYCTYTDETRLYSKGRSACQSEGWRVAYDWETGQEVERLQLSFDQYASGYDIYWRGVTDRATGQVADTAQ